MERQILVAKWDKLGDGFDSPHEFVERLRSVRNTMASGVRTS